MPNGFSAARHSTTTNTKGRPKREGKGSRPAGGGCWPLKSWKRRRKPPKGAAVASGSRDSPPPFVSADEVGAGPAAATLVPPPAVADSRDPFHYFGIPLRTPADYYHFLDSPTPGWAQRGMPGSVKVLGVAGHHQTPNGGGGKRRRRGGQQVKDQQKQSNCTQVAYGTNAADGRQQQEQQEDYDCCPCTCAALPSTSQSSSHCGAPLFGRLTVRLRRERGQQLGLGIAGGTDKPIPPTVSYLRPGFLAHRCDQINVGDRLLSVDGIPVHCLSHWQVLSLLRAAGDGDQLELELEYDLDSPQGEWNNRTAGSERRTAELELRDEGEEGLFGFSLRGGAYGPDPGKSRPLTVAGIRTGGAAHREGRLRPGDRVTAINGMPLFDSSLANALDLIRAARPGGTLLLGVEYDVFVPAHLHSLRGPLLLEIEKAPGVDFGIRLDIRQQLASADGKEGERRRTVVVQGLVPASVADRCGAVRPGDELLSVDGISLELVAGLAEAYQLLGSQSSLLRLELLRTANGGGKREDSGRRGICSEWPPQSKDASARMEESMSSDTADSGRRRRRQTVGWPLQSQQQQAEASSRAQSGSLSARLASSFDQRPLGSVCHAESMELALAQEGVHSWPAFGIVLGRQKDEYALEEAPLVIAKIERGSPADKSGVLQPGDRLLCINDWHTADGSLEEAQHLLHALSLSTRSANVVVEFTVIEPVLPPSPSSLFLVRLAKRGNSLGIVCRSEHKGATKGEPLVISHIRMGSVAHRCGSIQVGDRIHSIDDIPLDACTVEEAMRLLQRSGQVVKLCLGKGGGQEQDLESAAAQLIFYSVEMCRRGQPLGVTIASSGALLDPIVISRLAPGGLAERTGAVHVGDRILAINGESLEGKSVAQATRLLQHSPDPISLKLCRQMAKSCSQRDTPGISNSNEADSGICPTVMELAEPKLGTPLKSVDSAMDSLKESPTTERPDNGSRTAKLRIRSSNSNHFYQQADLISAGGSSEPCSAAGWDSGMSSGAATDSQPGGGGQPRPGSSDKCCACQQSSQPTTSSSSPHSSCTMPPATGSQRQRQGEGEREDWVRVLEALETVGEEEMLRKLEECILSGQASNYMQQNVNNCAAKTSHNQLLPPECGVLSRRFVSTFAVNGLSPASATTTKPVPPLRRPSPGDQQQRARGNEGTMAGGEPPNTPPSPLAGITGERGVDLPNGGSSNRVNGGTYRRLHQNGELPPPMPAPRAAAHTSPFHEPHSTSTFASPMSAAAKNNGSSPGTPIPFITSSPLLPRRREANDEEETGQQQPQEQDELDELSEVFSVHLTRCPLTKSFGFSICDGPITQEEPETEGQQMGAEMSTPRQQGIHIRSVVEGGPAERSAQIRPGDRVLQINGRSIQFLSCDLALPLLATEHVELLLLRRRGQKLLQRAANH